MYGLTELFRSTPLAPAELDRRPDLIGKAIPNAEVMVVRPEGTPCDVNEPGELVHRRALGSLGYWNDPEKTAERFEPAPAQPAGIAMPEMAVWSGNTVRREEEGFLYFIGRPDEMIKTSGYGVSPTEVEEVVYGPGAHHRARSQPAAQSQRQDRSQAAGAGIRRPVRGRRMTKPGRPVHVPMDQFPVADDCLVVGGMPLPELARRIGRTPFYAYDRRLISERVELLRTHLPRRVHLHYAIKANPMPEVVAHLAGLVDGLDVASAGELEIALEAGARPDSISFAGPGKADRELERALAAGIIVNLESEGEMERLAAIASRRGARARVNVRVNPDFELKSSGMKMGGGPKPFGVDAERVPAMLHRVGDLGLEFRGFHIYSGAQNLRAAAIADAQRSGIDLAVRLAEHAPAAVRTLNIGGGFGIPYFPGDERLDLALVGRNLEGLLESLESRLPQAQVVLELGRFLVGEAGIYVCRVIERKISRGHCFLVTDGGLHHHLAASGNFGQVVRKNYPVAVGNRVRGAEREAVSVVGPLCTPLDLLADNMEMAKAEAGDLIVVFQSGAYGLSASPTAFLRHPLPAEILV